MTTSPTAAGDGHNPHQWLSIEVDGETFQFDVTFLTSSWRCIYGDGCPGIGPEPAVEAQHGCCTHGAHFVDKADRKRVLERVAALRPGEWQLADVLEDGDGPIAKNDDGEWTTVLHEDACIFLNRPDHPNGAGCALHQAAVARGERPIDWKPTVCWQLPIHVDYHRDDHGHLTYLVREWKRRDWGEGGEDFHWWCTEEPQAFDSPTPVYVSMRDDLVELIGERAYGALAAHIEAGVMDQPLPHPARRAGSASLRRPPG
ncbi:MAG: hypothetical protein JJU45_00215 [Acidimicrobiia bacterium]|nr:hypothetical protein [Acidimicrobiia bacterium]